MSVNGKRRISRKQFLQLIAAAGGSSALYMSMRAMGLLAEGSSEPPKLSGKVQEKKIIILGAGLAGLSAVYELEKSGYVCELIEARERVGGRCWTVRDGSQHQEMDGRQKQARFDETLYFNPGPARIPQHHFSTLHYCKIFGLELELFANSNQAAYLYQDRQSGLGGEAIRIGAAKADLIGYQSELLSKAISNEALNAELNGDDQARLLEYLYVNGALDETGRYKGGERRGYREWPGAFGLAGEIDSAFPLSDLLRTEYWQMLDLGLDIHQQMNMFQIAGGTDRLANAFEARIKSKIKLGAEVTEIRKEAEGVRVVYEMNGEEFSVEGDACICTLPLSVLKDIDNDLSAEKKRAMGEIYYLPIGKMGLQFNRRFWEEDDAIFGGISWTNMAINQIWYPSTGYLGEKGMLVGYYHFGPDATRVGRMSDEERLALALQDGEKIHPQYRDHFESSYSVAWEQDTYSKGGFAYYDERTRNNAYAQLLAEDDRIFLAGEHMSYLNGWMAGAFESTWATIEKIHARAMPE